MAADNHRTCRHAGGRGTLVPAKIAPPRPGAVYERRQLFRRLDGAIKRHPIIWVSAPAGAGKTTLAASYLASRGRPRLWYQCDSGDVDPATFFHYLQLAVQHAMPRRHVPLPHLTREYASGLDTFARRYFEALGSVLAPAAVIVLDNYHDIPSSALLHELLCGGIDALPQGITTVVLSRAAPPPAFARGLAAQAIGPLTWDDLQLTRREAESILRLHARGGSPLNRAKIASILEQAHGWAAGLLLMLSADGADRLRQPSGSGAPALLFDYFATQLFERSEPDVQAFLLATAFLPSVAAPSIRALGLAEQTLPELLRRNYFLTRTASGEPNYQYHPLFRAFLRQRAKQRLSAEEYREVQRCCAQALLRTDQPEPAIELLVDAQDYALALEAVLAVAPTVMKQGRAGTLLRWFKQLPRVLLERAPWACYWLGLSKMNAAPQARDGEAEEDGLGLPTQPLRACQDLEEAYRLFRANGDWSGQLLAFTGIVDAVQFGVGRLSALDPLIDEIKSLLASPRDMSADLQARVVCALFTAIAYRRPQDPSLDQWWNATEECARRTDDAELRARAHFVATIYALWTGQFAPAQRHLESLRACVAVERVSPLMKLAAMTGEVRYTWLVGSPATALDLMERGLALTAQTGVRVWEVMLYGHGMAAALSDGQMDKAEALRKEIAARLDEARPADVMLYLYLVCWQACLQGDGAVLLGHVSRLREFVAGLGIGLVDGLPPAAMADALRVLRRYSEVHDHAERVVAYGERVRSHLLKIMGWSIAATTFLEQGDTAGASRVAAQLFALAREQHCLNYFGWDAVAMRKLCLFALERGIERDYVCTLIRSRNLAPLDSDSCFELWPFPVRIRALGEFEILVDGKPLVFSGKVQKKPLELVKALIVRGGRGVWEHTLADVLWPDADGDSAAQALATTLHRLRRLLGEETVDRQEGRLSLDSRRVWVDAWALERGLERLDSACRERRINDVKHQIDRIIALYRGPLLAGEPDTRPLLGMRERLRVKFLRHLDAAAQLLSEAEQHDLAIACYQKGIEIEPVAESLYRGLMRLHLAQHCYAEALTVYERCRASLLTQLSVPPSSATERLAREIRSAGRAVQPATSVQSVPDL